MITIIGVGHVFDINKSLENAIIKRNPTVVCVELDPVRYQAVMSRGDSSRGNGDNDAPFIYMVLAKFQEKIAKKYGQQVGSEMVTAIETAKMLNARLALIEMDASRIISNFWRSMKMSERMKFMLALFMGLFVRKKRIEKELKRFEESEDEYLEQFGDEFPAAKRVLIDDRNQYMANAVKKIASQHENMVVVVGDGHVEGIRQLLGEKDIEIIRLSQLREKQTQRVDEFTVSYQVSYQDSIRD